MSGQLSSALEFFGSPRQRHLRFATYSATQKAYTKVGMSIAQGNCNAVIAFGDGSFSSSSRGHPSGPVKGLFKHLKSIFPNVRKVWEFRTSVVCSKCDGDLEMLKSRAWSLEQCKTTCLVSSLLSFSPSIALVLTFLPLFIF